MRKTRCYRLEDAPWNSTRNHSSLYLVFKRKGLKPTLYRMNHHRSICTALGLRYTESCELTAVSRANGLQTNSELSKPQRKLHPSLREFHNIRLCCANGGIRFRSNFTLVEGSRVESDSGKRPGSIQINKYNKQNFNKREK